MRVLVTGGCGFIGSALVRQLVRETDADVVSLDLLTYAASPAALEECGASPRHVLVHGDVRDPAAVAAAFAEADPDVVFHLAAETHVDRSLDAPAEFVTTNVVGTAVLLEAALSHRGRLAGARREAFRFVHVSTDEVFGPAAPGERFTEGSAYRPQAPYAATKAGGDHLARSWHAAYGLPVIVTCSSNNYGPWQFPEKLVPLVILRALQGEAVPLYGDGAHERDWLHVEDHARALRLAARLGRAGATYLFGSGTSRRNEDVVNAALDALDGLRPDATGSRRRLVTHVAERPAHDRRYALDPSAARSELGWTPSVSFEEGLRATVAWYLDHEPWWQATRERYRQERLGLSRS